MLLVSRAKHALVGLVLDQVSNTIISYGFAFDPRPFYIEQ